MTTPMKIYSKHDTRNSAVFSEFLGLDLSGFKCGGIYLYHALECLISR